MIKDGVVVITDDFKEFDDFHGIPSQKSAEKGHIDTFLLRVVHQIDATIQRMKFNEKKQDNGRNVAVRPYCVKTGTKAHLTSVESKTHQGWGRRFAQSASTAK